MFLKPNESVKHYLSRSRNQGTTMQKTFIDNCLKYKSIAYTSHSECPPKDPKPKTISFPREQNKKLSQRKNQLI